MKPYTKVAVVSLVMFSLALAASGNFTNTAAAATAIQRDDPEKPPNELSNAEYNAIVQAVLNDKSVQEHTNGKQYHVMSYDFIGNTNDNPFVWHPELHINVNGTEQLTVVTNKGAEPLQYSIKEVRVFTQGSQIQAAGGTGHAFAINSYTGSSSISGIRMSTSASSVQTTAEKAMAFALNGVVATSSTDATILCGGSTQGGATYFGQVGFQWGITTARVMWGDTLTTCNPQYPAITYSPGQNYDMKIFSVGSPTQWYLYIKNLYTGEVMTTVRSGITSSFLKNNSPNTSVFLETQATNPNGSQFITFPSATSTISTNSGSTWFNWESGSRDDKDCIGTDHFYPYDSTKEVINGNLASGGSATYDTTRMATYYPAC